MFTRSFKSALVAVHPVLRGTTLGVLPANELAAPRDDRCANAAVLSAWQSSARSAWLRPQKNVLIEHVFDCSHRKIAILSCLQLFLFLAGCYTNTNHLMLSPMSPPIWSQAARHRYSPVGADGFPRSVPTPIVQTPKPVTMEVCESLKPLKTDQHTSLDIQWTSSLQLQSNTIYIYILYSYI